MQWSVGLQTCPRAPIDGVLESIDRAGWSDITIYAEPGSPIPVGFGGRVCFWPERYGDWTNWISGLFTMFMSQPKSDYYLMCEDDIELVPRIRPYLEYALPKLGDFGAVSLYTPTRQTVSIVERPCFHDESWRGWRFWGGQAIVFSRSSLGDFLASEEALLYRQKDDSNGHKDTVLGLWAKNNQQVIYDHSPSLVQHLAIASVTGNSAHTSHDFNRNLDPTDWIGKHLTILPNPMLDRLL